MLRTGDRADRQLPSKDRSSDASEGSLLEDVLSTVSGTDFDFNSSLDQGWSVTSSTAMAFGSAGNLANVCIEQIHLKDTMAQSRQCHKQGATCAGMPNHCSFSLSLGTLASV